MNTARIETERLILRPLTPDDATLLTDLDSDPEVMRYINGGTPTPLSVVQATLLPRMLAQCDFENGFGYYMAYEKATGNFVGWFQFRPIQPTNPTYDPTRSEIELGYRLKRAFWGQGYATEGGRALLERGFASDKVTRVVATALRANRGSWHVMAKLGMTLDRAFTETRIEGSDQRAVKYALEK